MARHRVAITGLGLVSPYGGDLEDFFQRVWAGESAVRWMVTEDEPRHVAVRQLEQALAAVEAMGIPLDDERLAAYAPHVRAIAEYDIAHVPQDPDAAIEYAVLGTAGHEPVLAALRRLAHQDLARGRGRAG